MLAKTGLARLTARRLYEVRLLGQTPFRQKVWPPKQPYVVAGKARPALFELALGDGIKKVAVKPIPKAVLEGGKSFRRRTPRKPESS